MGVRHASCSRNLSVSGNFAVDRDGGYLCIHMHLQPYYNVISVNLYIENYEIIVILPIPDQHHHIYLDIFLFRINKFLF